MISYALEQNLHIYFYFPGKALISFNLSSTLYMSDIVFHFSNLN